MDKYRGGDEVLRKADVVLTVGYDTIEYEPEAWLNSEGTQVIHLDALPTSHDRAYRPAVELIGDIPATLDVLSSRIAPLPLLERPEVSAAIRALAEEQARGAGLSDAPIHPLRFMHELGLLLSDDITVTCDVGAQEIWMARYFFCYEPRHLLFGETDFVKLAEAFGAEGLRIDNAESIVPILA